jgi:hypothetical protein
MHNILMVIAIQQPDGLAYTKRDVQLIKFAPADGLIYSETCRASYRIIKSNNKKFLHLVCSYTYFIGTHSKI